MTYIRAADGPLADVRAVGNPSVHFDQVDRRVSDPPHCQRFLYVRACLSEVSPACWRRTAARQVKLIRRLICRQPFFLRVHPLTIYACPAYGWTVSSSSSLFQSCGRRTE